MNLKNRYSRWLGTLLCAIFLAGPAAAGEKTLDLARVERSAVSLTEYLAVLEDSTGALTLEDVTRPEAAARFKTGQALIGYCTCASRRPSR